MMMSFMLVTIGKIMLIKTHEIWTSQKCNINCGTVRIFYSSKAQQYIAIMMCNAFCTVYTSILKIGNTKNQVFVLSNQVFSSSLSEAHQQLAHFKYLIIKSTLSAFNESKIL